MATPALFLLIDKALIYLQVYVLSTFTLALYFCCKLIVNLYNFKKTHMRNNRNTIGDQYKPPQRSLTNSIERKTMTNPQTHQTQSRQINQQQQNQKMASTINSTLLRLPNQGNRSSISNSLQPKASTMISTISTFLNSIDRNFQKKDIDIEGIPALLQFWGYPHNYNKSVFQPIGAPHTWPNCLQMMEFFAQIANYFFQYRLQFDQYKLDNEEIDLILDAFSKNDCADYEAYLDKTRSNLTKQQQDLTYKIQSSQLTLRNIKNSQRSVSDLQAEEQVLLQKLQRQSQTVIEIDQRNNAILSQIQKVDDQTQQLSLTKDSLIKKAQMLEEQISNQELGFEEASKIELDIKQYNSKIRDLQTEAETRRKQFQTQKNGVVEMFYRLVDDINQIKTSARRYQAEMLKRNIQMILPQADHISFAQAIHSEDPSIFQQAAGKIVQGDKIKAMLILQQSLSDILQHELKQITNQLAQNHFLKSQTEGQNKQLQSEVQKLHIYSTELQTQQTILSQKLSQISQNIENTKRQTNRMKKSNEELFRRQIQLTQSTKQIKEHMVEGIKMMRKYEAECEQIGLNMEERETWLKAKVEDILARIQGGFGFLNQQLSNLL